MDNIWTMHESRPNAGLNFAVEPRIFREEQSRNERRAHKFRHHNRAFNDKVEGSRASDSLPSQHEGKGASAFAGGFAQAHAAPVADAPFWIGSKAMSHGLTDMQSFKHAEVADKQVAIQEVKTRRRIAALGDEKAMQDHPFSRMKGIGAGCPKCMGKKFASRMEGLANPFVKSKSGASQFEQACLACRRKMMGSGARMGDDEEEDEDAFSYRQATTASASRPVAAATVPSTILH